MKRAMVPPERIKALGDGSLRTSKESTVSSIPTDYPKPPLPEQQQGIPGTTKDMEPKPDLSKENKNILLCLAASYGNFHCFAS